MKMARYVTATAAILLIFSGGILNTYGWSLAKTFILAGFGILIFGYIPVFLWHISKKWDKEDQQRN